MEDIVNLFFEAKHLKELPRTGYPFLGVGRESVAEHSFMVTFIAYVMARMRPEVDGLKLMSMCLLHDLPEARMGDLNYVQKKYVTAHEDRAVRHLTEKLPFGNHMSGLLEEFNEGKTPEARLAKDADQLSFVLELKALSDRGGKTPDKWLDIVKKRIKTETGQKIAEKISTTQWDDWWMNGYSE